MSFIQCKDENEVEEVLGKNGNHGFVSDDHRIYSKISLSDDASYYEFDSKTALTLLNLQHQIEFLSDGSLETSFLDIVSAAEDFKKAFVEAVEAIKFKKIQRFSK